jgi:hypothetical protein
MWTIFVQFQPGSVWFRWKDFPSEPRARYHFRRDYLSKRFKGGLRLMGPAGLMLEAPCWEQRRAGRKVACQPGGSAMTGRSVCTASV